MKTIPAILAIAGSMALSVGLDRFVHERHEAHQVSEGRQCKYYVDAIKDGIDHASITKSLVEWTIENCDTVKVISGRPEDGFNYNAIKVIK